MLHKRPIREKLLKGGAWAFSGRLLAMLTGLIINALLTRLLSPQEMGAYFLTFSLVSITATVAQLGLTQTIVRLVADSLGTDQPGKARRSVVLALRITAICAMAVAGFMAVGAGGWIARHLFHSVAMSNVMLLASAWVFIVAFQNLIAETYRGFHDIKLATIFGGLLASIMSMLVFFPLWAIQGHGSLKQIVGISVGAGLTSLLGSSALLWNMLGKLPRSTGDIRISEILHITWPIWFTNLTFLVLAQADLWIMGLFRSAGEVAIYGIAIRMSVLLAAPLTIVNAVVPPLISEMHAQGKLKELERILRAMAALSGLPAAIILAVVVFFGSAMLKHLFGTHYQAGDLIMIILCVGQFVNVWAGSNGMVLMLTGHQMTLMLITISTSIVTVALAWTLVSRYGGAGVAIASGSGMIMQNILMLFFVHRRTGIWTHASPMQLVYAGRVLWKEVLR